MLRITNLIILFFIMSCVAACKDKDTSTFTRTTLKTEEGRMVVYVNSITGKQYMIFNNALIPVQFLRE